MSLQLAKMPLNEETLAMLEFHMATQYEELDKGLLALYKWSAFFIKNIITNGSVGHCTMREVLAEAYEMAEVADGPDNDPNRDEVAEPEYETESFTQTIIRKDGATIINNDTVYEMRVATGIDNIKAMIMCGPSALEVVAACMISLTTTCDGNPLTTDEVTGLNFALYSLLCETFSKLNTL